ncbi:MAG TPA: nuclear transport factor 2 family protein, partial [Gemmatimonadales bacterium]
QADTLYMVGATAVADGRVRVNHPFFAGLARGGSVNITGFQAEISSGLAWAMVDYRWLARDGRSGSFARATLVLEPVGDAWRIKHVHSSTAQP